MGALGSFLHAVVITNGGACYVWPRRMAHEGLWTLKEAFSNFGPRPLVHFEGTTRIPFLME